MRFTEEADLGGGWSYIQRYAIGAGIDATDACARVLERTCQAVAAILDAAEQNQTTVEGKNRKRKKA
jgi:hypothetical protein